MLRILRNGTFRRLFLAQAVALVGTGLLTVALGLLAYDLAGSAAGAVLGTALAIKMAAYVFVAPVVTAVAHRVPRRGLLLGANVIRATIAAALPFVAHTWQIYALIFVLQAASATFTPAFQSVIPAVLVDEDDYTRGLAMSRLAYDLESLVSPVLAAALLTIVAYDDLFLGTVAGFAMSACLVLATPLPDPEAALPSESFWQRTTLGSRVMLGSPVLRGLLLLNLVVACATALVVVNTVVYVRDVLLASDAALAVVLASYGGGSMAVALVVPRVLGHVTDRSVMRTGAVLIVVGLCGSAVLLLSDSPPAVAWPGFLLGWAILGAGTSLINTPSARLLRYQSTSAARSSVFTAQFSLSHACFFITYPLAGWLGVIRGQGVVVIVLAAVAGLASVTAFRVWPAMPSIAAASRSGARVSLIPPRMDTEPVGN